MLTAMGNTQDKAAQARTEVHRCKYRLDRELGNLDRMKTQQVAALRAAVSQPRLLRARARELVITRGHIERLEGLRNQVERLSVTRVTVETTTAILNSIKSITEQMSNSGLSWDKSRVTLSQFAIATKELEKSSMMIESTMDETSTNPEEHDDIDDECARVLDEYGLSAAAQLPDAPSGRLERRVSQPELKAFDET